jgi:hypothetical protein
VANRIELGSTIAMSNHFPLARTNRIEHGKFGLRHFVFYDLQRIGDVPGYPEGKVDRF